MGHRKIDAFPADNESKAPFGRIVQHPGILSAGTPAKAAGAPGITQAPTKKITDRHHRFVGLNIGHAGNRIGNFAPDVDAIPQITPAAGAAKGLSRGPDNIVTVLVFPELVQTKVAAVPNGGGFRPEAVA